MTSQTPVGRQDNHCLAETRLVAFYRLLQPPAKVVEILEVVHAVRHQQQGCSNVLVRATSFDTGTGLRGQDKRKKQNRSRTRLDNTKGQDQQQPVGSALRRR